MDPSGSQSQQSSWTPPDFDDVWSLDFRALAGDLLTRPIVLSPEYLAMIEREMNHPDNRDGADKSWVGAIEAADLKHFERAVPLQARELI